MKRELRNRTTNRKIWSATEVEILKQCMTKHGVKKGAQIASELLKVDLDKCLSKMRNLRATEHVEIPTARANKTAQALEVLRKHVRNNPNNLTLAFKLTAEETGLATSTISSGWYDKKSPIHKNKVGVCFLTMGNSRVAINRKNCNAKDMLHMAKRSFKKWLVRTFHITRTDL